MLSYRVTKRNFDYEVGRSDSPFYGCGAIGCLFFSTYLEPEIESKAYIHSPFFQDIQDYLKYGPEMLRGHFIGWIES